MICRGNLDTKPRCNPIDVRQTNTANCQPVGTPLLQNAMQVFALDHGWAVYLSATVMTER